MPGSSSWMPSAPQGVQGFHHDDNNSMQHLILSYRLVTCDSNIHTEHITNLIVAPCIFVVPC